jgi:hypothetical protein
LLHAHAQHLLLHHTLLTPTAAETAAAATTAHFQPPAALLLLLPQQGQALALGPNCTLLTADGRPLVGADGDFIFLGKDGKTLVDQGKCCAVEVVSVDGSGCRS